MLLILQILISFYQRREKRINYINKLYFAQPYSIYIKHIKTFVSILVFIFAKFIDCIFLQLFS